MKLCTKFHGGISLLFDCVNHSHPHNPPLLICTDLELTLGGCLKRFLISSNREEPLWQKGDEWVRSSQIVDYLSRLTVSKGWTGFKKKIVQSCHCAENINVIKCSHNGSQRWGEKLSTSDTIRMDISLKDFEHICVQKYLYFCIEFDWMYR